MFFAIDMGKSMKILGKTSHHVFFQLEMFRNVQHDLPPILIVMFFCQVCVGGVLFLPGMW